MEDLTPAPIADVPLSPGTVGNPADLGLADYQDALDELQRIDDVNMVCAPDATYLGGDVRRAVHQAMISHCLGEADRIAIIDPPAGLPPSGPGSVEQFRGDVQSERGFAALYYPWLVILDPTQTPPMPRRRIHIPPSGHIAGVMARVDTERGVFKAPANVPVRNVLGVERIITDREQAPLNRGGTNVLRILPGSNDVMVWGARTTVDKEITDWIYVNVRRLLLFIEESIQESIRWAVFEPNDTHLWKSLERIIRAFLRQQWRAGALFGRTEDEAFLVRIDEGLNPPEVRNIGRLNIEIRVAPVRPAEFIVITIGLFDGGTEVDES
jgi:phage tail sheath protein FI